MENGWLSCKYCLIFINILTIFLFYLITSLSPYQHGPVVPRLSCPAAHLGGLLRLDRGPRDRRGPGGRHLQPGPLGEVHGDGAPHHIPVRNSVKEKISIVKNYVSV